MTYDLDYLKKHALFRCHNKDEHLDDCFPTADLRVLNGKPICQYCSEFDECEQDFNDLPPFDPFQFIECKDTEIAAKDDALRATKEYLCRVNPSEKMCHDLFKIITTALNQEGDT